MKEVRNSYLLKNAQLLKETNDEVLYADEWDYNCASFALGLFDQWYCPYGNREDFYDVNGDIKEDYLFNVISYEDVCDLRADYMIGVMESEELCREITKPSELQSNEYLVLFRCSDDDFHFARRTDDGRWWHKAGNSNIQEITADEAFDSDWWYNLCCPYSGKLRYLAVRKVTV